MIVIGMLLFILNKIKGDLSLLLIEYFEGWKDKVVFLKVYKYFLLEFVDLIKLCYIVNLYVKFEELSGEIMYGIFGLKYRLELFDVEKEYLKIIGEEFLGYFEVLVEVLKVLIY